GWFDFAVADMSAMNHYRQKMEMGEMGNSAWFLKWAEPRQLMRNSFFINSEGSRFLEAAFQSGIDSTGWTWATRFADLDNDGWEDLIFSNGVARDVNNSDHLVELAKLKEAGKLEERKKLLRDYDKPGDDRNKVFRNQRDLTFEDMSESWGYNQLSASYGLLLADLDRDGDLDAIVNNMNQPLGIYRNEIEGGNAVLLSLRGTLSNSFGVGAKVRLKTESGWQTRILSLARGYLSGGEPILHFGLGEDETIEELEIHWPSGAVQTVEGLPANQHHTVTEPEGRFSLPPALSSPRPKRTLFSTNTVKGLNFTHTEDTFDDYEEQPLLPWGLSRLGPGLAFGDADADGDEDLWVGGASGQPGRIIERSESSGWSSIPWGPWDKDAGSEDMGALFFDPDKDGDLDLYVASGGNRVQLQGEPILEDRLYLNVDPNEETDSPRGFAKANPDPNPEYRAFESAASIAAADFDRDGDMDFLVTSRTTPGEIHEAPPQRLLANVGDRLADVTEEMAPGLQDIGMATGAIWSDVDGDADLDLLVTTAWGPIHVFLQNDGVLTAMDDCGLSEAHGWWQGIDGGDFDGDGDMDFIATNLGLNTKYKAS
ncbi:MAG: VCBS repeat-containing protein, partial [Verrucomicrobiota bacterium]